MRLSVASEDDIEVGLRSKITQTFDIDHLLELSSGFHCRLYGLHLKLH